ncbi:MAG: hypothetical protein GY774_34700 [Planctomycetes bacterium]|nr:hypothetical protein [Planctomycetota bacterium]
MTPDTVLNNKLKLATHIKAITSCFYEYYQLSELNAKKVIDTRNIITDCRAGCDFCCNLRVDVRPHEIFLIIENITNNFSVSEKGAVINTLKNHKSKLSKMTFNNHISSNVPCPLLDKGKCLVYTVRPFSCRAYHSLDVSSCRHSFEHPDDLEEARPRDQELDSLWHWMGNCAHEIYNKQGFDTTVHELGTSLLEALTMPSNSKRWRKKKKTLLSLRTYLDD